MEWRKHSRTNNRFDHSRLKEFLIGIIHHIYIRPTFGQKTYCIIHIYKRAKNLKFLISTVLNWKWCFVRVCNEKKILRCVSFVHRHCSSCFCYTFSTHLARFWIVFLSLSLSYLLLVVGFGLHFYFNSNSNFHDVICICHHNDRINLSHWENIRHIKTFIHKLFELFRKTDKYSRKCIFHVRPFSVMLAIIGSLTWFSDKIGSSLLH